jgi:D-alanyl-D-alanine carboxypeptidase/D-alanyl-D-alanine-endopeptidase (penicillin-binding protein 4)
MIFRFHALGTLFICSSLAHAASSPEDWASSLRKKLQPLGSKASLSIQTMSGTRILDINESQPVTPASIAKIISTGCSLDSLTPGYTFKTEFLTQGNIKEGGLTAPLIVKGSGDPSFVIEDLREEVARLRQLYKIQKLTGPLQIDVSYLDNGRLAISDAFEGDDGRAFTADLTSLIFNYNSFAVWVAASPGERKPLVEILPSESLPLKLDSSGVKIKAGNPGPGNGSVSYDPKTKSVRISGTFGPETLPKAVYRSAPDAYEFFYNTFHSLWLQSGGNWQNPSYQLVKSSEGASLLARHESRALSALVRDVNKNSLNLPAEMILLAAGAEKFGWPASREKSSKVVSECLKKFETPESAIHMDNASGLSKSASIRTEAFTTFIQHYLHSASAPDFIASLPVLGQDGTVKDRFKQFQGRARVKTGTLANVGSISGLVFPEKGEALLFTFVINGLPGNSPEAHKFQNLVLESMLTR